MSERPPAKEIAESLRRISREKEDHLRKWGSQRPDHWRERYQDDIAKLDWAVVGYDKLADVEANKNG